MACAKGLEWFQRGGNIRMRSANGTEIGSMVPETEGTQHVARRWKRGRGLKAGQQCDCVPSVSGTMEPISVPFADLILMLPPL